MPGSFIEQRGREGEEIKLKRPFISQNMIHFFSVAIHRWAVPDCLSQKCFNSACSSVGKESGCNAGDLGSIPGSERSPGGGNGNPLEYSCLENPMDRGAWWAVIHGVTTSWTRLSN